MVWSRDLLNYRFLLLTNTFGISDTDVHRTHLCKMLLTLLTEMSIVLTMRRRYPFSTNMNETYDIRLWVVFG